MAGIYRILFSLFCLILLRGVKELFKLMSKVLALCKKGLGDVKKLKVKENVALNELRFMSRLIYKEVSFLPGVIPIFADWVYSECMEYQRSSSPSKVVRQVVSGIHNCGCLCNGRVSGGEASHPRVIVGSVIAGCVLLALLVVDGVYAFVKKGELKEPLMRAALLAFTLVDVNKYTNKFLETNNIGTGGYGMVSLQALRSPIYLASLPPNVLRITAQSSFAVLYLLNLNWCSSGRDSSRVVLAFTLFFFLCISSVVIVTVLQDFASAPLVVYQRCTRSVSIGRLFFAFVIHEPVDPYRQAKTLMFIHVSPDPDTVAETVTTLNFAERVSTVKLGTGKSNNYDGDSKKLKEQVAFLKATLAKEGCDGQDSNIDGGDNEDGAASESSEADS
nr:P-loop nucleoside triphosphate hydrolases superfamily protein with CH (Calponin Homology) domain-containing protein [Tanacetum cinerariifolium]